MRLGRPCESELAASFRSKIATPEFQPDSRKTLSKHLLLRFFEALQSKVMRVVCRRTQVR